MFLDYCSCLILRGRQTFFEEKILTAAVNLHFLRTGHARNIKPTMPGDWLLFYLFIVAPKKEARFLRASLDLKNRGQQSWKQAAIHYFMLLCL